MWYYSEATTPPLPIDNKTSKKFVYVTKDVEEFEREIDGEIMTMYRWREQKIPKEDWEIYRTAMQNTTDIADLTDAVIELAGILGGE